MKHTIALAQIDSVVGDLTSNIRSHAAAAQQARDGGAELVVFPELSLTGYSIKDATWDITVQSGAANQFAQLLDLSKDISILAGGVEESAEFGMFNSAFLFEKGSVRSVHRKVYLPSYGMFEEQRYFSPGRNVNAFESAIGKTGVLICEDFWHLSLPYLLAHDGAQVIIAMAASPTRLSGNDTNIQHARVNGEHHRTIARLLSSYVVFCNRIGYEDGVNFWGGSEVVGPDGEVVIQAKQFEMDMVFAEIDDNEVRRARRFSRHFLDENLHLFRRELNRILDKQ